MTKYVILLPLHDNNGKPVPESAIQESLDELFVLAGGYTVEGRVHGAYRMQSGTRQEDELIRISVAIRTEMEPELRNLVRQFCRRFEQECIWFERTNSDIEFVPPPEGAQDD